MYWFIHLFFSFFQTSEKLTNYSNSGSSGQIASGRNCVGKNVFSWLLFSSKRCVVLCDRQPGWHPGTIQHLFIIHSEVAAVQQLFLHITPLSSPSSSACQKAEPMCTEEEEDLKICLRSHNMVTPLFQMGELYNNICLWKAALKSLSVFHTRAAQDQNESIKEFCVDHRRLWRFEVVFIFFKMHL